MLQQVSAAISNSGAGRIVSPLLEHLSRPLPAIASKFPAGGFPTEPQNEAEGEEVLKFFASELNMGLDALKRWRDAHLSSCRFSERVLDRISPQGQSSRELVSTAVRDLHAVMSPHVRFVPSELRYPAQTENEATDRSVGGGDVLVARHDIEPGTFLFSVLTESALCASSPMMSMSSETDADVEYFSMVEDLCGQLAAIAQSDVTAPLPGSQPPAHLGYVNYLRQHCSPPLNLPFLQRGDLHSMSGLDFWDSFHKTLGAMPQSDSVKALIPSADEYAWYVSLVLSRRAGGSMIVPLLDTLNHCNNSMPNAYYTMATESTFCGLDVVDNIMAGVDNSLLFHPYLHCFTLSKIPKGQEITLSYSDADPRTQDGGDVWKLLWGFRPRGGVPEAMESDLRVMASVIAERRIDLRSHYFPNLKKAK